jgi:hypothetical protein
LPKHNPYITIDGDDRGRLQCCDLSQGLGVEKQEDSGNAVGQCVGLAAKKFFDPYQALFLSDCALTQALLVGDAHRCVEAGFLRPGEEVPDPDRVVGPDASHSSTVGSSRRAQRVHVPRR